jgi:hypothetical protein
MRSLGRIVRVVVIPPLVRRCLRVALRRVLPRLVPAESSDVKVIPGAAHLLVAAIVDEVGPEDLVSLPDEGVGAVPLVDVEVLVEVVRDRVPGDVIPPVALLQAPDLGLGGAGGSGSQGGRGEVDFLQDRVERLGAAFEVVGGVGAEPADVPGQVGRHGAELLGGDQPALGAELADCVHDVEGVVEDDQVGEQGVELDELLLLVGVVAGQDAVVAELEPVGEPVVGLDYVESEGVSSRHGWSLAEPESSHQAA